MSRRLAAGAAALLLAVSLVACAPADRSVAGTTAHGSTTTTDGGQSPLETAAGSPAQQHVTGQVPAPGSCHYRHAAGGVLLPDPACTPGAVDPRVTQANIASTICVRGYTARVRPPVEETDRAKHALMLAYGQTRPNELDHLVPLELGGSSDMSNLWPEPPPSPNPKDRVESELHDMVCAGIWYPGRAYLPLDEARRLIVSDWTTAVENARTSLVR